MIIPFLALDRLFCTKRVRDSCLESNVEAGPHETVKKTPTEGDTAANLEERLIYFFGYADFGATEL